MTREKKTMLLMTIIGLMGNTAAAEEVAKEDTLHLEQMREVQVVSLRATSKTPVAHSNLNRE